MRPSLTDHWSNVVHEIYADVDVVFDFFSKYSKTPYFPLQIVVFTVGIPYPLREAKTTYCRGFHLRVAALRGVCDYAGYQHFGEALK